MGFLEVLAAFFDHLFDHKVTFLLGSPNRALIPNALEPMFKTRQSGLHEKCR